MPPLAHAAIVLMLAFVIAGIIVKSGADQIGVQAPVNCPHHSPPS